MNHAMVKRIERLVSEMDAMHTLARALSAADELKSQQIKDLTERIQRLENGNRQRRTPGSN